MVGWGVKLTPPPLLSWDPGTSALIGLSVLDKRSIEISTYTVPLRIFNIILNFCSYWLILTIHNKIYRREDFKKPILKTYFSKFFKILHTCGWGIQFIYLWRG